MAAHEACSLQLILPSMLVLNSLSLFILVYPFQISLYNNHYSPLPLVPLALIPLPTDSGAHILILNLSPCLLCKTSLASREVLNTTKIVGLLDIDPIIGGMRFMVAFEKVTSSSESLSAKSYNSKMWPGCGGLLAVGIWIATRTYRTY